MEGVEGIIPHVFHLLKFPDGTSEQEITYENDGLLLRRFISYISHLVEEQQFFPSHPFPNAMRAFHVWGAIQDSDDDELLSHELGGLQSGHSLPMYVRAQNAGLVVTLTSASCDDHPAGSVVLSTFAASQKSFDVTSAEGDLIGSYPTSSVHVGHSPLLTSRAFAKQVISLNNTALSEALPKKKKSDKLYDDQRDVADPRFVSKWLCGVLCDKQSCRCTGIPHIVKKVRDEVMFGGGGLLFRRSGIWMAIKVVLQILLVQELGPAVGRQTFKVILLGFMCLLCKCKRIGADAGIQMMAKIGRRLYKLRRLEGAADPMSEEVLGAIQACAEDAVGRLRVRLDTKWNARVAKDSEDAGIPLSGTFDFRGDSVHGLAPLRDHIKSRTEGKASNRTRANGNSGAVKTPDVRLSLSKLSEEPFTNFVSFGSSGKQALDSLFCFELAVLNMLSSDALVDFKLVCVTFVSYLEAAKKAYDGDPVGYSRAILVSLKILRRADQEVCRQFPLMLTHKTGIPIKIVEHLMLPFDSDLMLAHELETYFAERETALYPNLIDPYDQYNLRRCYPVRHAVGDSGMEDMRRRVLAEGEMGKAKKFNEVELKKSEWQKLQVRIQGMSCDCTWVGKWRSYCKRCNLKTEADRMSVSIYEKPLPFDTDLQNVIAFELLIPEPICYFRDMLCAFLEQLGMLTCGDSCGAKWSDELRRYAVSHCKSLNVRVGSKSAPQNRYRPRDLHPSENSSRFVIENAGDCRQYACGKEIKPLQDIPDDVLRRFVFTVDPRSLYSDLQWTLDDHEYKFSDNQILAVQNKCPVALSLTEFKEFGSIRAGHRIQLRNLYRALKQGTLSLRAESVLSLVCEVLWRAGPRSKISHVRQSHVDLLDGGFIEELLSLLGSLIESSVKNWDDHHTYTTIIVVLLRVFAMSHSTDVLEASVTHLKRCRVILLDWCKIIERELDAMQKQPVAAQNEMRRKLVAVAALCSYTYWSDPQCPNKDHLARDMLPWLQSVKIMQEYASGDSSAYCSNVFRNQLRRITECGIASLGQFLNLIKATTGILQSYAEQVWSGMSRCGSEILNWRCLEGGSQWFQTEVTIDALTTVLHVDILEGHFLVNGKPGDSLPPELKNHQSYLRVFGDYLIKVQPLALSPWKAVGKHPFQGEEMHFEENLHEASKTGNPFIISAMADGDELEYLPVYSFTDKASGPCFQRFLIRDHTHWWSEKKGLVYIRSSGSNCTKYQLDLATGLVVENATNRHVICNTSSIFNKIMTIFERIEQKNYIEVFLQNQRPDGELGLDVQLPRMRLKFLVVIRDSALHVTLVEYPGMKVAAVQRCSTLVGLQNCLLLEPAGEGCSNKLLLIPHGTVSFLDNNSCVTIGTTSLRDPPYFVYEVDSTLLQLRCGQTKSACAYLAYLHALTSHPLPDPFTQHTGTERAIQLLQSGHCWSCEPYDDETAKTLWLIAELSPVRKYNSGNSKHQVMTSAKYPLACSLSCSDAFRIIVEKLISDSQRLSVLFEVRSNTELKLEGEQRLSVKSYWRYFQCTTEQAHITPEFLALVCPSLGLTSRFDLKFGDPVMCSILELVSLVDSSATAAYSARDLHASLINRPVLRGHLDLFPAEGTVADWCMLDFWDSWLMLYVLAKRVKRDNLIEEWKMTVSCYAFLGVPEDHLVLLQTVAIFPELFDTICPPECKVYKDPRENTFDAKVIRQIIESNICFLFDSFEEKERNGMRFVNYSESETRQKYEIRRNSQIDGILSVLQKTPWPFRDCDALVSGYQGDHSWLDLQTIRKSVNSKLSNWFDNYQLKQFVMQVEAKALKLNGCAGGHEFDPEGVCEKLCLTEVTIPTHTKNIVEFGVLGVKLEDAFQKAKHIFRLGKIEHERYTVCSVSEEVTYDIDGVSDYDIGPLLDPSNHSDNCKIWELLVDDLQTPQSPSKGHCKRTSSANLNQQLLYCASEQQKYWNQACSMLMSDSLIKFLITAGIYQRITPLTQLPLISLKEDTLTGFQKGLRNVLGAFGVAETCKRHAARCLKYMKSQSMFELQRELANSPHQNWSPADRPDWLLLEIEMDLLVRPVQKQVAEWMEHPAGDRNTVTQLNMGEGKTAVITPLLVLALTDKEQLCRVTVLKSLFNTNRQALRQNLGGFLLNRRVYSFPCRRDYQMSPQLAQTLFDVYKECMEKGGVNITTPEYRLSFQLKMYEQCKAGQHQVACTLLQVQDWLRMHARDILDESDEILSVKYQLVYAIGLQMPPAGGCERWAVLQRLLEHVPEVVANLAETQEGEGCVQILKYCPGTGIFPLCRLMKMDIYPRFCRMIADRLLSGTEFPNLQAEDSRILHNFLTEEVIDSVVIQRVFELLDSDSGSALLQKALILRGLLACGVMFSTLSKRWRVNYGVSPNCKSLLAVPFRAKDVAAERTEFGHVDVAQVLTHLSYYYSGLSESQVSDCLYHVSQGHNPEMEYGGWIGTMKNPESSIVSLRGINIENALQRNEQLFPALRNNKAVIDYWLANIMLPVAVKQFPEKMTSTSWDLSSDKTTMPTTGFSGTNDTQILLPLTIAQCDLPELKRTNFEVYQKLRMKENNGYECLPSGVMSRGILEKLARSNISLLLDVGALMLDLDNKEVAQAWLDLPNTGEKSAAVYFSAEDRLMVMDRSALEPVPFEISPFRGMLEKCVIYLDDVHTRGTDLKLPAGIQGCVTLGKGVTKDKLVQGCMRLRKLGQGHTVCFWASEEVHNEITAMAKTDCPGSAEVLRWALNNSRNAIRDGFPYWVAAACNYLSKATAQKRYDASVKTDTDRTCLAREVSVKEVTELKEMYGSAWCKEHYPVVAEQLLQKYCTDRPVQDSALRNVKDRVIQHCRKFVPDMKKNAHLLDEEQERELEQEQEEEREVERPAGARPHTPKLDQAMVRFLKQEQKFFGRPPAWAKQLPEGLQRTNLVDHNEVTAWGSGIYVTEDFVNTVVTTHPQDSYLRTTNWVVSFSTEDNGCVWLLMSPFEVNALIPMFRSGQLKAGLHMYAAKLSLEKSTLLDVDKLVLPVGSTPSLLSMPGFGERNASLSIFTGCTFFSSSSEFDHYCAITGYVPNPRSPEEEHALHNAEMDNTGFVLPRGREEVRPYCRFQRNPERLIVGVITCRYNYFSRLCHLARLVHECSKPTFDEDS